MRVAVCLSGEMRGCLRCLHLLHTNVIDPFKDRGATVHLFLHTRKDKWFLPAMSLEFRGLWIEENHRLDDSVIISPANPRHAGDNDSDKDRRAFLYQSYLQQYHSLAAVGEMCSRAQAADNMAYDWVVRTRPDCYLTRPLQVEQLVANTVNVPWNDWWPYEINGERVETVTDKFAIGPGPMMDRYFRKREDLQAFCQTNRIQGEGFTAWQMRLHGIPYVRNDDLEIRQMEDPYKHSFRPDRES